MAVNNERCHSWRGLQDLRRGVKKALDLYSVPFAVADGLESSIIFGSGPVSEERVGHLEPRPSATANGTE